MVMLYNFCSVVVVFFTSVNFDPWFVFSQRCCLHFVFCYGEGNYKWKNLHVDGSSQSTDWQRYIFYYKTKRKQSWLSDLFTKMRGCFFIAQAEGNVITMEMNTLYISVHSQCIFIKQNYKPYCNFHQVTIHIKILHFTWSNAKCSKDHITGGWGRGVKRGSTVQGKTSVFLLQKPQLWAKPHFWRF
jgi:hypothetical protein